MDYAVKVLLDAADEIEAVHGGRSSHTDWLRDKAERVRKRANPANQTGRKKASPKKEKEPAKLIYPTGRLITQWNLRGPDGDLYWTTEVTEQRVKKRFFEELRDLGYVIVKREIMTFDDVVGDWNGVAL